jgi:hypothetical protein
MLRHLAAVFAGAAVLLTVMALIQRDAEQGTVIWAPQVALGEYMGQRVRAMVPDGSTVLVIVFPNLEVDGEDMAEVSLKRGLEAGAGSGIEFVGFDLPSDLWSLWAKTSMEADVLTKELFDLYLQTYPAPAAIISEAGVPDCSPGDFNASIPPLLVVQEPGAAISDMWLRSDSLKLVVAPVPYDPAKLKSEILEDHFEILIDRD